MVYGYRKDRDKEAEGKTTVAEDPEAFKKPAPREMEVHGPG